MSQDLNEKYNWLAKISVRNENRDFDWSEYNWRLDNFRIQKWNSGDTIIKKRPQKNRKDRHKTSESGLYDELDYELNPRDENFIQRNLSMDNASILNASKSQNRTLKQKKIIVPVAILVVCMVGGIAALLILVPNGKNILCFNYTTAQHLDHTLLMMRIYTLFHYKNSVEGYRSGCREKHLLSSWIR